MPLPRRIGNHVYSRGACWPLAAFVLCRVAALRWAPPSVARQAALELVAVQRQAAVDVRAENAFREVAA